VRVPSSGRWPEGPGAKVPTEIANAFTLHLSGCSQLTSEFFCLHRLRAIRRHSLNQLETWGGQGRIGTPSVVHSGAGMAAPGNRCVVLSVLPHGSGSYECPSWTVAIRKGAGDSSVV
jgi:hypothetical protein